jgi:hypothetical protein
MNDELTDSGDGETLDEIQAFDAKASADFANDGEAKTKEANAILWERLPSDTDRSYEAFRIYRDLGGSRTFVKVAEQLKKSTTIIRRWSVQHSWAPRVQAWDAENDRVYAADLKTRRREMAEETISAANKIAAIALRAIEKKFGPNLEKLKPNDLKPRDMLRFVESFVKLKRIALGEPTDIVEQQVNGGNVTNDGKRPIVPLTEAGRNRELDALFEAARARAGVVADAASAESEAMPESSDD